MDDFISRKAAVDALQSERQRLVEFMDYCLINEMYGTRYNAKVERNRIDEDISIIEDLPTAAPSVVTMKLKVSAEDVKKAMQDAELTLLPAEKRGKWIKEKALFQYQEITVWRCDQCGRLTNDWSDKYCSGCGARMEE